MSHSIHDVIVVGAGPGGLSAAWELVRAGFRPLVLEQSAAVGDVWRNHYDGLRLNTGRLLSTLPGSPLPRSAGGWPTRDDLAQLLETMPARGKFTVQTGIEVRRIERRAANDQWVVTDSAGHSYVSAAVVVATGGSRIPVVPDWISRTTFDGRLLHSSAFRHAREFTGQRVLVVGCGNSAAEIASRLTEFASEVICSVRTVPHLLPRSVLGIPMAGWGLLLRHLPERVADALLSGLQRIAIGDLSAQGLPLPRTRLSRKFRETNVLPTLYVPFSADVRAGRIRIVGQLRNIEAGLAVVDERVQHDEREAMRQISIGVDAIILGTGFRTGLQELIQIPGLIDAQGRPAVTGAQQHPKAPRLFFIGQSNPLTGQLREIRIEAKKIAATAASISEKRHQPHGSRVSPEAQKT